jgi:hypothetical protein
MSGIDRATGSAGTVVHLQRALVVALLCRNSRGFRKT